MLADDVGVDGGGGHFVEFAHHVAEASGVKDGARADDAVSGQTRVLPHGVGKDIHGVGGNKENAIETAGHHLVHDGLHDVHVLVHQLQAGFAGFLGCTCADDHECGISAVFVGAFGDLGAGGSPDDTMVEVHDVAFKLLFVDVDDGQVVTHPLVDQCV